MSFWCPFEGSLQACLALPQNYKSVSRLKRNACFLGIVRSFLHYFINFLVFVLCGGPDRIFLGTSADVCLQMGRLFETIFADFADLAWENQAEIKA